MSLTKSKMIYLPLISFIIISLHIITEVAGHGRLIDPPSRSSMWRFGFKTEPNYNDSELFCGGYKVHWQRNKGKCGVCGDAWDLPSPRPNEAGGVYGRGIIVKRYQPGQVIQSTVEITANNMGFFEFKLCPHNNPSTVVTQDCLDQHLLEMADGSGYRYYPSSGNGPFKVQLRLPDNLTCSQCVFQWTYTAGNNWGRCENGTSKVGCGPQETFRGCADVSIGDTQSDEIPSYSNDTTLEKISISPRPQHRQLIELCERQAGRRLLKKPLKRITRGPITRRVIPRRPINRRPINYLFSVWLDINCPGLRQELLLVTRPPLVE